MGVSYDKATKTWKVEYEKNDRPIQSTVSITVAVPETTRVWRAGSKGGYWDYSTVFVNKTATVDVNGGYWDVINALNAAGIPNPEPWTSERALQAAQVNARAENQRNLDANNIATANNQIYKKVYESGTALQKTKEAGNYLTYKNAIDQLGEGTPGVRAIAKNQFDDFYKNEIVSLWDTKLGAKVPFEGFESTIRFDPDYYGSTDIGKASKELWDKAVKDGNLDFLGRYPNYQAYALYHYSTIGKNEAQKNGQRDPGFKPLTPSDGFEYLKVEETVPSKTDADRQFERDKITGDILGLKPVITEKGEETYQLNDVLTRYTDLVTGSKALQDDWNTAKYEIEYAKRFPDEPKKPWAKLYDAVKKADNVEPEVEIESGFGELLTRAFRLNPVDHPDAAVLINKIKADNDVKNVSNKVLSEYDVALTQVTTDKEKAQTEKAGVFRKEFLREAQKELIKAKQAEQKFDLLSGTSFGKEILGLRENLLNSALEESGIGGILSLTGKKQDNLSDKLDLSFDTGKVFGSKNGLLYNWEKWFYDEIEKKYSNGLDVPNDYVPEYARTLDNGFVTPEQAASWKEYDDAFEELKLSPNSLYARQKTDPKNLPKNYVPVDKRQSVKQEWIDYEQARKAQGWVDNKTLIEWSKYDDAYDALARNPNDANAKQIYDQRPADYIPKEKRIDGDIQFKQDFFNQYLMPRFNKSKSMSEFLDYIDVEKNQQNIFQTEDRLQSLSNAAQAASSQWMKSLDSLKPSKFNSQYYFDPGNYYLEKGIGNEGEIPVLLGDQFKAEWGNTLPKNYLDQKKDVETAWEAARKGLSTKDENGNDINWQAKAYLYGFDVNNKDDFARLHYEVVGQGKQYDGAPDVFNPRIAQIYLKQVLVPYLNKRYAAIGTVFGQFADPAKFAEEFVNSLNLAENKEARDKVFKMYGLDPDTEDLTELKKYITEALSNDSAIEIREQIKKLNEESETPTQELLGVEYIQRDTDKQKLEAKSEDALFNRFKAAGFQGTEEEFYSEFMPDATEEDKKLYQAAQTGNLKDVYSFRPTGDPFTDIGSLEALSFKFDEEEPKTKTTTTKKTTEPKSKYFSFFPGEDAEEEEEEPSSPVKIKRGSDILAEFKSKLGLSSTAGKSSGSSLSDPFSNSFFGSF